jgi:ParB-like chromosome segregation protein Spo0J
MNIQTLPLAQLNPAPYNPRLTLQPGDAAWAKLERSLAEFDLVQPIVWNRRTGHVVAGHQRLRILEHHGRTEIECVVVDLPLEKEQALNVALNNSSVGSDWDPGKLLNLVTELQAVPDFDVTLTGFDERQLRELVLAPAWPPEETAEDDAESHGPQLMQAVLEIPRDDWEDVQPALNALLAAHAGVRLHVSDARQSAKAHGKSPSQRGAARRRQR